MDVPHNTGGNKGSLLGRKKEEREKGDERILGSGDFVANVMKDANEVLDQIAKFDISLVELISRVCAKFGISVKDLVSKSRNRQLSQARGVICYLAVDELGYSGDDVARRLRISGRGVSDCRERGKKTKKKVLTPESPGYIISNWISGSDRSISQIVK